MNRIQQGETVMNVNSIDSSIYANLIGSALGKNLFELAEVLRNEASKEPTKLSQDSIIFLSLLSDICLLVFVPDSENEPYQPFMSAPDGRRSFAVVDLNQNQLFVLRDSAEIIPHTELVARVYDILWLNPLTRNINFARSAIDFYSSQKIHTDTWSIYVKNGFERAYRLARKLNIVDKQTVIENLIIYSINDDKMNFSNIFVSLANFIEKLGLGRAKDEELAARMMQLGEIFKLEGKFIQARNFFEISARRYLRIGDQKNTSAMLKFAECFELEADIHFNIGGGSKIVSAAHYESAIQAYRAIPKEFRQKFLVDEKIVDLRHKHNEAGRYVVEAMPTLDINAESLEDLAGIANDFVSNISDPLEALVRFCFVCSITPIEQRKKIEIEHTNNYFFTRLFAPTQYSYDGRVIADVPALGLDRSIDQESKILNAAMIRSFLQEMDVNVKGILIPALKRVLLDHNIDRDFIFSICRSSTIVPRENIDRICHALWLGFERDFSTAVYLVAPQVEQVVRGQLKNAGAITATLNSEGIEHENGLSTLLELPQAIHIFGEDLVFVLKATFTDSNGPNLRNDIAHGLLTDNMAWSCAPIFAWWLLLRMVVHPLICPKTNQDDS